jgi:voltage-gated potassium channel
VQRSDEALQAFERRTALPMLLLALLIIPLLVIPLVVELSPRVETTFVTLDWTIWAVFAGEYLIRLYLAPRKWLFVRHNVLDLVVVIVPFLRPLRVARSARALRFVRAGRTVIMLARSAKILRAVLTRHKLHYVLLVTLLVTAAAAVLVRELEKNAEGANIQSLDDAVWWALTTITTVGYGDRFPVTPAGRGVAVLLMILGVGLFGLLAASLASFFIQRDEEQANDPLDEIRADLAEIKRRLPARRPEGPSP